MTHIQFLRIKKLTGKSIVLVAARHNLREILAEVGAATSSHIDPARTRQNAVLRGSDSAAGVANAAQTLMDNAGVKPLRKDAVRALEIIFSLPAESTVDHREFFSDAVKWAEAYFELPVISAVVHNDEATPHCHALLLPLVSGRMVGSDLMGGRGKLQALQTDFHANVGQAYGLARQARCKRLSASIRRTAIDSAFTVLEANSGLNSGLLRVLLEPHLQDPEPLMQALGLSMPVPKPKGTFAGIMTKPCKPEPDRKRNPIGFVKANPIGFADEPAPQIHQTLSCVGFANSSPPIAPAADQSPPEPDDYSRERDTDIAASWWDSERGEFIKPPSKTPNKAQVLSVVRNALGRMPDPTWTEAEGGYSNLKKPKVKELE